ncbi:MAG: MauE/DoxX family redox-associated membrane protein [Solirubrobacteraceae bacterium]
MAALLLVLRLILVAVLAVAGVAKLADRNGARAAVIGFGVPAALAGVVAALLPIVELVAAALLLTAATAAIGAGLAAALMLTFCTAITRSLLRGEAPECHCFGALHSEPAGAKTVARNLILAGAATAVALGGPGTSPTGWIGHLDGSGLTVLGLGVALTAALLGGGAVILRLLRRNGELLLRVDELEDFLSSSGLVVPVAETPAPTAGLPIGTPAPDFALPSTSGTRVSLADLVGETEDGLLLVFSDPACGPCSALMPQIAQWQRERPSGLRTVLITRGGQEANLAHAVEHGLSDVLVQTDREVSEGFAVSATPSAMVLAADGTVASAVHSGEDEIRALVSARAQDVVLPIHRSQTPAQLDPAQLDPAPGRPAPDPALRTLDGKIVRLVQKLPDGEALLVFWDPDCGFCERMLDSLRELDAHVPGLVVISTGSPAANRAMGLRAPILLDDGLAAGSAFGAMGTPSAVLIGEDRRVASTVAVGADAVLALAGAEPVAA